LSASGQISKKDISKCGPAASVLLLALVFLCPAYSAPQSSQPVLKAIDPSQAKLDNSIKNQAIAPPSPNPLGGIKGAPISGNKQAPPLAPPIQPQSTYEYPAPQAVQSSGYPQQPPQYGGQPKMRANIPPYPNGSGQNQGYPAYPQQNGGYGAPGAFPPDSMIPDFNKPLPPPVTLTPGGTAYGGAPSGFLTQPPQGMPQRPQAGPTETRITKLEQAAFGSTYPEHEVEDRLDHLEKEVLGAPTQGAVDSRIATLESKLGGSGTFTQAPTDQGGFTQPSNQTAYAPSQTSPGQQNYQGLGQSDWQTPNQSSYQPPPQNSYAPASPQAYAPPQQAYAPPQQGYAPPKQGYETPQQGYSAPQQVAQMPVSRQPMNNPYYNSTGLATPPPAVSMTERPGKNKKQQQDNSQKSKRSKSDKGEKSDQPGADYFGMLKRFTTDGVARWRNLPVRIHMPENSPASWQRSLDVAIKRWGDHLPLKVVEAAEPADVDVSWVNKLVPQYLGITRLVLAPSQMRVQIFLLRPTYYLPEIPEKTLANVFLHELGHGLGIFGHSDSKQDLMYGAEVIPGAKGKPAEIRYAGLSDRDINTLKHIYALPPLPEEFATAQPLEWGSGALDKR